IEVLHGRGQVAREDLARIVVEGEHGRPLRIQVAAVEPIADDGQGMGDLGHAQAVLLDVLRVGAVHQPPAPDELHPEEIREEAARGVLRCRDYWFRRRRAKPRRPWGMKMTLAGKMVPTGMREYSVKKRERPSRGRGKQAATAKAPTKAQRPATTLQVTTSTDT